MDSKLTSYATFPVILTVLMITASFGAMAQSDSTPQISDFVAPELPPVPSVSDPSDHSDNWLHEYYNDDARAAHGNFGSPMSALGH